MRGSVYRRCGCRDANGRQLGRACPKLGNKRHGSWAYVVDVGEVEGKRQQRKCGGFATKAEAEQAMRQVLGKAARGVSLDDRATTGEWLRYWLAEKTKRTAQAARGKK